ncbi:EI24 domain-containing protein [uncultured Sphingomonas sp.]|uniref:EI24 domain-containing protein n=1 Tax=uncultured Sphingomonas sp. TaxID=158754 RepID=UPI0035CB8DE5
MIRAFALSIGQLGDPATLRVLAGSIAITCAVFGLIGVGIWFGVQGLSDDWLGFRSGALSGLVAVAVVVLGGWLLFVVVAIAVLQMFADRIVAAVEARHYPAARATAHGVGPGRAALMGLRSAARALLANLVALPVYIVLLFTGIGPAIAFFLVNAWVIGRDLGDMVAARYLRHAAMRGWRKANRSRLFVLGLVETGLFVVPLVNILAPVIGAAMATHLFHEDRA